MGDRGPDPMSQEASRARGARQAPAHTSTGAAALPTTTTAITEKATRVRVPKAPSWLTPAAKKVYRSVAAMLAASDNISIGGAVGQHWLVIYSEAYSEYQELSAFIVERGGVAHAMHMADSKDSAASAESVAVRRAIKLRAATADRLLRMQNSLADWAIRLRRPPGDDVIPLEPLPDVDMDRKRNYFNQPAGSGDGHATG